MKSGLINTLVAMVLGVLTGCMGSPTKPFEVLSYKCAPDRNQRSLVVFLQGMGGTMNCMISAHKCFEVEGFVDAVQSRELAFDMAAPNAHYRYYQARTLMQRLREDVILPAKAAGYEKIWLVGVSLGGLGALFYLIDHPHDVDGVLLLGPYLGNKAIINEVAADGRLSDWQPGHYTPDEQWQRMLWHWLKQYPFDKPEAVPIFLGIGTQDRYYKGHKLLANHMPPEQVIEIEGKHRFSTFKSIWDMFLDRGKLQAE